MRKRIAIVFIFFSQFVIGQCAMCKAVVESGDAELAEGVNSGIVYLMIFPYILVGGVAYLIYRNRNKFKL